MQEHNITPEKSLTNTQVKDNKINGLKPHFNTELFSIELIDFDAEQLLKQCEETKARQFYPFPFEVFPLPVQKIITATNESLNYPIDFTGASLLYAASVAIGNTYKVQIKDGFQESAVLYLALVAKAGTNKSHPLSFALKPIFEQDKRTYRLYEQQRQEFDRMVNLPKRERKEQGIDEPVKPVWQKMLLSDFTPEALAEVHKYNKRGIGVYVDELAGWFKNFNRYSKGSEMEFWLSSWSSKPINIDRKGGEPTYISSPFISVAGTIQTSLLIELAKDSRTHNGFIDRILFVIPDNIQKPYWSEAETDQLVFENWESIISNLLTIPLKSDNTLSPTPEILQFTPESKRILMDWQRTNTDQCNEAETEAIGSIYSKLDMYVVRLALILELISWACDESDKHAISVKTIEGAIKLIEYFRRAAARANSIISNANPLDKHPLDKQNLYKALPNTFLTETGLQIAENYGVPERTFKRFLTEIDLFKRISRGEYEKLI